MAELKITELELRDIKIIEPALFEDGRGYFSDMSNSVLSALSGINIECDQICESMSRNRHTLRGIHFQNSPHAQAKVFRCLKGKIKDVLVDLRKDSRDFGKYVSVELSENDNKYVYIPIGFGHAFLTLEDNTIVNYIISGEYSPECRRTIRWNDPDIGIDWGITDPILSEKDRSADFINECDILF